MKRKAKMRSLTAVRREWARAQMLTLSDGGIWRYYNGSNFWECLAGAFKDRWSDKPIREDLGPLTAEDVEKMRVVKFIGVTAQLPPFGGAL
jgi:hypothetical protein